MQKRHLVWVALLVGVFVASFCAFSYAAEDAASEYWPGRCKVMAVGKDATVDGCTIVMYNMDSGGSGGITKLPAQDYPPGTMMPIWHVLEWHPEEPAGYIPQVEHTYAYLTNLYKGVIDIGTINEHGLAIANNTVGCKLKDIAKATGDGAMVSFTEGKALLGVWTLTRIALERCKTARCAIKTVGALAEEYGFAGCCGGRWSVTGQNMTIGDGEEAWLLQIMPTPDGESAIWVAQRVPDDGVVIGAGTFRVREIDFDDPGNFMYSDNITEVAEEQGWWKPGEPFDFAEIYGVEQSDPYRAQRKIWRVYDLLAPSQNFDPWDLAIQSTFSVTPDNKVSVDDIFRCARDYYEGTQFDLTEGPAAGPFGCPVRYRSGEAEKEVGGAWESPMSIPNTCYTYVAQSRPWLPGPIGSVVWWGADAPHTTVYVPFYAGVNDVPQAYSGTTFDEGFTRDSAFWAFTFVGNWANLRFNDMIKKINEKQEAIEGKQFAMQPAIETAALLLYGQDPELAREFLTDYCTNNANDVVNQWWDLADYLIQKYDGGGRGGYPAWWLKQAGYDQIAQPEE